MVCCIQDKKRWPKIMFMFHQKEIHLRLSELSKRDLTHLNRLKEIWPKQEVNLPVWVRPYVRFKTKEQSKQMPLELHNPLTVAFETGRLEIIQGCLDELPELVLPGSTESKKQLNSRLQEQHQKMFHWTFYWFKGFMKEVIFAGSDSDEHTKKCLIGA